MQFFHCSPVKYFKYRFTPTSSYESVGCYSGGGQTSDGGHHGGHQNDCNGQSCRKYTRKN